MGAGCGRIGASAQSHLLYPLFGHVADVALLFHHNYLLCPLNYCLHAALELLPQLPPPLLASAPGALVGRVLGGLDGGAFLLPLLLLVLIL